MDVSKMLHTRVGASMQVGRWPGTMEAYVMSMNQLKVHALVQVSMQVPNATTCM